MVINKLISNYNFNVSTENRIKYIVIHYVGALGDAKANATYYASSNKNASAHYFVGHAGDIWQSVEDKNVAWHCGASIYKHTECRNANSIGIEMCVRKKNIASLNATDRDWYFEDATISSTIELVRELMSKYNINADNIVRHYDVTDKICPNPYVYSEKAWSDFKNQLSKTTIEEKVNTTNINYYRVRKTWEDAKSQIGAYSMLDNAIKACKDGYTVFDSKGIIVYKKNSIVYSKAD